VSDGGVSLELLEPGQRTARELEQARIAQVVEAHEAVLRAGSDFIAAAAKAGTVLLELKERHQLAGAWRRWIEENLPFTYSTAHRYMQCAKYEPIIREQGWTKLSEVRDGIGALVEPDNTAKGSGNRKPEWMKKMARAMHADGTAIAHIAREVGASPSAVKCWVDPEHERVARQKVDAINKRRIRAERALREQERAAAIKQAVKKHGGAIAEAYARAERDQDIIAQAQREATDPEAKRHLSEAGAAQRRYRDLIVRALGVA
jgi:hypothetical protein